MDLKYTLYSHNLLPPLKFFYNSFQAILFLFFFQNTYYTKCCGKFSKKILRKICLQFYFYSYFFEKNLKFKWFFIRKMLWLKFLRPPEFSFRKLFVMATPDECTHFHINEYTSSKTSLYAKLPSPLTHTTQVTYCFQLISNSTRFYRPLYLLLHWNLQLLLLLKNCIT